MSTQLDPRSGKHKVVRYDSRSTTASEPRYAQMEIESAAVQFAIKRNHMYIYGLPEFTVVIDNKPLLSFFNGYRADTTPRIQKHKLNLQEYKFKLVHEPGENNPADYMSRHPTVPADHTSEQREAHQLSLHVFAIIRDDLPS